MDTQSLARRFKIARPKWSLKTSFWSAVVVLAIVSLTIIVLFKKSIWIELEIVTGVLSLFMFAYFFFVLYHGVRFDRKENYTVLCRSRLSKWIDATSGMDTGGFFTQAGSDSLLGAIIGFLLDLLVSMVIAVVIAFLLWLGASILLTTIAVLFLPLFFLFRRSIRYVVAKGRLCHDNVSQSVLFALRATVTNTAWLYLILIAGQYLSQMKGVVDH